MEYGHLVSMATPTVSLERASAALRLAVVVASVTGRPARLDLVEASETVLTARCDGDVADALFIGLDTLNAANMAPPTSPAFRIMNALLDRMDELMKGVWSSRNLIEMYLSSGD